MLVARVHWPSLRLVEADPRGDADDALQGVAAGIAASRRWQGAHCGDQCELVRTITIVSRVDGQHWGEAQSTRGGPRRCAGVVRSSTVVSCLDSPFWERESHWQQERGCRKAGQQL